MFLLGLQGLAWAAPGAVFGLTVFTSKARFPRRAGWLALFLVWMVLAATMLTAEAAGVARWALRTAAEYAKVREQFGRPIGSFQAIKHLCVEMLLRSEQADTAAADAARAAGEGSGSAEAGDQLSIAAAVAAATAIAAAKDNAKDCIQVLGGIGITWEHDAHLYLRRAYGIGQGLGGARAWLRRVVALTRDGVRRNLDIDLGRRVGPRIPTA